jgi:hypothetical protein
MFLTIVKLSVALTKKQYKNRSQKKSSPNKNFLNE